MRVAFSASFWKVNEVRDILHRCDQIFTTNWDALEELRNEFGHDKINLLPHGYRCVIDAIKNDILESYKGIAEVEFIDYSDLYKVLNYTLRDGGEPAKQAILTMGPKHFGLKVMSNDDNETLIWMNQIGQEIGHSEGLTVPDEVVTYVQVMHEGE